MTDKPTFDMARHAQLLREAVAIQPLAFDRQDFQLDQKTKTKRKEGKARIRCPICTWAPTKSARWYCFPMGAPEHFTGGCGKRWHTFDTRGQCPGCSYQWRHTTCLKCNGTSLHEEWYEKAEK